MHFTIMFAKTCLAKLYFREDFLRFISEMCLVSNFETFKLRDDLVVDYRYTVNRVIVQKRFDMCVVIKLFWSLIRYFKLIFILVIGLFKFSKWLFILNDLFVLFLFPKAS